MSDADVAAAVAKTAAASVHEDIDGSSPGWGFVRLEAGPRGEIEASLAKITADIRGRPEGACHSIDCDRTDTG